MAKGKGFSSKASSNAFSNMANAMRSSAGTESPAQDLPGASPAYSPGIAQDYGSAMPAAYTGIEGGPRDDPATYGWSSVWSGQESTGEKERQTRNPLGYTPKYDRDIYSVTAPSSYEVSDEIGMSVNNVNPSMATATWPTRTANEYQMTTDPSSAWASWPGEYSAADEYAMSTDPTGAGRIQGIADLISGNKKNRR